MRTNNANSWDVQSAASLKTVCEEFSFEKLIFSKLYAENGPLVQVDKVWPMLGFNSRDTFNRAAQKQRIPIHVIRPEGRRKSFVATAELSKYLATLTEPVRGEMST